MAYSSWGRRRRRRRDVQVHLSLCYFSVIWLLLSDFRHACAVDAKNKYDVCLYIWKKLHRHVRIYFGYRNNATTRTTTTTAATTTTYGEVYMPSSLYWNTAVGFIGWLERLMYLGSLYKNIWMGICFNFPFDSFWVNTYVSSLFLFTYIRMFRYDLQQCRRS